MKKYLYIASCSLYALALLTASKTSAQSFTWMKNAGDNDRFTWGQGVVIDHHHNEVVCGFQNDSTYFGSILTPFYGDLDAYLAKYDSSGNVLWTKTIYGPGREMSYQTAVDTADNIYVVGEFSSPYVHFSPTDSVARITSGSNYDFFLAKYDKNGNFIWARNGGNTIGTGSFRTSASKAVAIDPLGNVVIGGHYQKNLTIGSTIFTGKDDNLFLAKYTPSGSLTWAKDMKSNSWCWITSIACDDTGNIYPTGKISDSLIMGGTKIAYCGKGDAVFFGKFNPSGTLLWMDSIINDEYAATSDNNFHCGNGILVDHSGYIYLGGSQLDTVILSTIPGGPNTIYQEGFIAKYNNAGGQIWMQKFGNHKRDVVNGIAMDAAGGLYATGNFVAPATFGGMALTTPTTGYGHIFVAKFDPATGNAIWLKTGGGLSVSVTEDYSTGIAVDQQTGGIATTGNFEYKFSFDGITMYSASTALSTMDMYLTRQHNPVSVATLSTPALVAQQMPYAIYPNPANTTVTINLSSSVYHKISIIDMAGRIVKEAETNNNLLHVDINELAPGTYTIAIAEGHQVVYQKLVKE